MKGHFFSPLRIPLLCKILPSANIPLRASLQIQPLGPLNTQYTLLLCEVRIQPSALCEAQALNPLIIGLRIRIILISYTSIYTN